ncbi:MAG: tRNA (adenosine(37)-N6)-threonylcarbamoyltransferase complex dimerization subunit type 1 TsaB [Candidatus Binatia bacterium]
MRILGLDTATWRASVGLRIDGEVVFEKSQLAEGSHAVSLLALIDEVLQTGGCTARDLDAVAVSAGPGLFTGLRIGLCVAKGLTYATGARLIAVPTLEALARTVADRDGVICPLLDARKGELYAACFESSYGNLKRLTDDLLLSPEALLEKLPRPCVILGDAVAVYGSFLQGRLGTRATLLPSDSHGPRGGVVAAMGEERLEAGQRDNATHLEPAYIRACEAELKSP